jgi:hypothetical protein
LRQREKIVVALIKSKLLITCGPSYEPIDQVRRITNTSTGKLGVSMADYFTRAGHEVICLKGEGSTFPDAVESARVETFGTNGDLARLLERIGAEEKVDAVFHAAALCDYRVEQVLNDDGDPMSSPKFATRQGRLRLVLAPAIKVLPLLRGWFPRARIAGWKYELAGTADEAFAKAWKQVGDCNTDACVLNGAAYGEGFAVCHRGGQVQRCPGVEILCAELLAWLNRAPLAPNENLLDAGMTSR